MRNVNKPTALCSVEGLTFGVLSVEETRKMSVLKVNNSVSFNQLGRPLQNGLYDCTMGPTSEKGAMCLTCSQNSYQCHGHLGHIELPLPVVNPVLRKELTILLRFVCNKCFRIQVPGIARELLLARLELLDMGLHTAAVDAEQVVADKDSVGSRDPDFLGEWAKAELKSYIRSVSKDAFLDNKSSRTGETLKRLFVDSTLKNSGKNKCCLYCKENLQKHFLYQCRFVTSVASDAVEEESDDDDGEKEPKPPVMQGRQGRARGVMVTVRADVLKGYLRQTWVVEQRIIEGLYPVLKRPDLEFPTDLFFISVIPVTPPSIRPVNRMQDGGVADHPQAYAMKMVLQDILTIQNIIKAMKEGIESLSEEGKTLIQLKRGKKLAEKLGTCWDELQADVDHILDKNLNSLTNGAACFGVKQVIEKKEGLLRMHMMGKRVNFAARSVITPDPNLNIDEIGIPEEFAKRLTYPTTVTPWNVEDLRKMIINGPLVHPGATMVVSEEGHATILRAEKPNVRKAHAKRLLTPAGHSNQSFSGSKTVHRHLCNGDILLLNRQPTLHRPSIMAHKARILKGEKTIRLHYANCSSYNADFDGDEMNAHFPQNEVARSEAYNLVGVQHQYLVPKNGTPLSGLIQDHVISGVKLTLRGRFFTKSEYQQLVYQSLCSKSGNIRVLPPSIIKPQRLWSGKQIISTVVLNILPNDKEPLSIEDTAKIGAKAWEAADKRPWKYGGSPLLSSNDMTEAEVIIRQGELLCGVLDKKHYGATPHGLIHCTYELYGGKYSALLLSAFSKLFTAFLQTEGFSLGVADILVQKKIDKKRSQIIHESRQIGDSIVIGALEVPADTSHSQLQDIMKDVRGKDKLKFCTNLDRQYKTALDQVTNEVNKLCLPGGLVQTFPENNLQLMVQSGAKGSTVNTMQISCLLGQIELEGKRPPLMISGKSLPSFIPFDTSPRAGGFVDGRFMTGIRPQEFFFHCMAGREGLIDTAVKTSRSGYLQRCLIKHLEGLVVAYDQTVRDSDGSIIQYYYGEDGIDVGKAQFLNSQQIHILKNNSDVLLNNDEAQHLQELTQNTEDLQASKKQIRRWRKKNTGKKYLGGFISFSKDLLSLMPPDQQSDLSMVGRTDRTMAAIEAWAELSSKSQKKYRERNVRCPDPVASQFRLDSCFGALSERMESLIENVDENDKEIVQQIVFQKSMKSQCPAGDPVGILAAQSVGEPSTQMTLNTFHFAGRGDMNVTLGIPRLRELLMMASKNLKTPAMDIPFLPNVSKHKAERLRLHLTQVHVADVLEKAVITESMDVGFTRQTTYTVQFFFLPHSSYKLQYPVKPKKVLKYMEKYFFRLLESNMKKYMKLKFQTIEIVNEKVKKSKTDDNEDDEEAPADESNVLDAENHLSSEDEVEVDEEAADANTCKEDREYDDPEEEEVEKESDEENDEEVFQESFGTEGEENLPENAEELLEDPDFCDFTSRVEELKKVTSFVQSYNYDTEHELWCEVIFGLPLDLPKLDMSTVLTETAQKALIWHIPKINKAFLYHNRNEELMLKVDGINIAEMCKHNKLLDLQKLYSNDIHAFANIYGIEAARRVLVKEVQNVFGVYGITVDPRHLLLIADYMTYNGFYTPMNRSGMSDNSSPLQQMSYETCMAFLRSAVLSNKTDNIKSPSASLVLGQICKVGTGAFDLRLSMSC